MTPRCGVGLSLRKRAAGPTGSGVCAGLAARAFTSKVRISNQAGRLRQAGAVWRTRAAAPRRATAGTLPCLRKPVDPAMTSSFTAPRRGELVRLLGDELRAHKAALGRLVSIEVGKIGSEGSIGVLNALSSKAQVSPEDRAAAA